jgi:hypothetical protein
MGQRNIWNEKVGGAIKESRDKWGVRKRVDCTGRDLLNMYVVVSGPDCIVPWITMKMSFISQARVVEK